MNIHYQTRMTNKVGEKYHPIKYAGSSEERVYQNGIPDSYLVRQDIYNELGFVSTVYDVCTSTDDLFEYLSIEYRMTEYEIATAIINGGTVREQQYINTFTDIEILHILPVGLLIEK